RKRMSIIVRFPNHRICIIAKGADSTITSLLRQSALAAEKANSVERRASKRKSIEAEQILRRNSEQPSRKNSLNRRSLSIGRRSIGGAARSNLTGNRLQSIRDGLDMWL